MGTDLVLGRQWVRGNARLLAVLDVDVSLTKFLAVKRQSIIFGFIHQAGVVLGVVEDREELFEGTDILELRLPPSMLTDEQFWTMGINLCLRNALYDSVQLLE